MNMKVQELIDALSKLDPELPVVTDGYEYDLHEVNTFTVLSVVPATEKVWWGGDYKVADDWTVAVSTPAAYVGTGRNL
jgi:hypothetical protein